ncbi:MAG TPA: class I SAM-dependent methyltransferase [Anaerolineales bacterium]|nr:class I SAM-dependent methyltransferase [Anaerolineales bacterium]
MIAAKEFKPEVIKRAYNRRSWVYSKTVAQMEWAYHLAALDKANIKTGEKVLEVAVGPGLTIVELAKRVGKETKIHGIDTSTGMLSLAEQNLRAHGFSNFELKEADSRQLPFEDNTFDFLYNGYMLDLIPTQDMPKILTEFHRVLKPGGRMVLLNMSKRNESTKTTRETLYSTLPAKLVLYVLGACRPVLMEGVVKDAQFEKITRTYLEGKFPSEIVTAIKPHTQ